MTVKASDERKMENGWLESFSFFFFYLENKSRCANIYITAAKQKKQLLFMEAALGDAFLSLTQKSRDRQCETCRMPLL